MRRPPTASQMIVAGRTTLTSTNSVQGLIARLPATPTHPLTGSSGLKDVTGSSDLRMVSAFCGKGVTRLQQAGSGAGNDQSL